MAIRELGKYGGSTPVPDWLFSRRDLSPGAKLCYAVLLDEDYVNGRRGCLLSEAELGYALGVTERQVRNYLRKLTTHRLILIERRGLGQTNRILIEHETGVRP